MKLKPIPRWSLGLIALAALGLPASGCSSDGNFSILGYTTQPLHDIGIRSVRVPIFKNLSMRKGLEFQLTEAVIREIQVKTPYSVRQSAEEADTELIGTIVGRTKAVINVNQLGENREGETTLSVEVVWRDLRPGHVGQLLSQPPPKPGELPPLLPPGAPAPPVLVQSLGHFISELGGSLSTAEKENVDRLAVQIVSMMEKPW